MQFLYNNPFQTESTSTQATSTPAQTYANPLASSYGYYTNSANMAQNAVSPESQDRAAARLRSSIDSQKNGYDAQIADQQASRGTAYSGRADGYMAQNRVGAQAAYAKGLGQLDAQYVDNMIKASNSMNTSAQGIAAAYNQTEQNDIERMKGGAYAQSLRDQNANSALNTYLTQGNALQNPGSLLPYLQSLGINIDPTFYAPAGTTSGGTTSGTDSGTTPLAPAAGTRTEMDFQGYLATINPYDRLKIPSPDSPLRQAAYNRFLEAFLTYGPAGVDRLLSDGLSVG